MRFVHIIRKFRTALQLILRQGIPLRDYSISGRRLRLYEGTLREKPDYDDAWFVALASRANVIYDVGANIGQTAVLAMLAGAEQLVLIDPNPRALTLAAGNLINNGWIHRIRVFCVFIGDRDDDEVTFWTVGSGAARSIYPGHARTASRKGKTFKVPTMILDTVYLRTELQPDLVKIDVKGAETMVIAGAVNLVSNASPKILVEMHHQPELTM